MKKGTDILEDYSDIRRYYALLISIKTGLPAADSLNLMFSEDSKVVQASFEKLLKYREAVKKEIYYKNEKTCSEEGCNEAYYAKGCCRKHWTGKYLAKFDYSIRIRECVSCHRTLMICANEMCSTCYKKNKKKEGNQNVSKTENTCNA